MNRAIEIIQNKLDGIPRFIIDGGPIEQEIQQGYRAALKGVLKDLEQGKTLEDIQVELDKASDDIGDYYYMGDYYSGYNKGLIYAIDVLKGEIENEYI